MAEFYRFRCCSALLDEWQELETQTIFFCEPKYLNDPMEGYRDIFWRGDYVAWINLFKNYLSCLERVFTLYKIGGDDFELKDEHIPVFTGFDDLPTPQYKTLLSEISSEFTGHYIVKRFAKELEGRLQPVKRNELTFYLSQLHFIALHCIDKIQNKNNLGNAFPLEKEKDFLFYEKRIEKSLDDGLITKIDEIVNYEEKGAEIITALMQARNSINDEMILTRQLDGSLKNVTANKNFLFMEFPNRYLAQLERVLFPEWYTACFMTECKDSAVWGHYGNNHTGACLIFESRESQGSHTLSFNKIVGVGGKGDIYNDIDCKLHKIDYIEGVGETDFFTMLGRFPVQKLNSEWYYFDGQKSICAEDMNNNMDAWREKYWNNFYRDITKKTQHWAYENEYRVILSSSLVDYSLAEKRKLKYDFSCLKGIIFGMKTTLENKKKIIEIIKAKCKEFNRKDFSFYQAYYNDKKKCIDHQPLDFLNKIIESD